MSRIQAALFDLDGVVFDTEGQYTDFYGAIGREFVPDEPDFAHLIKGRTLLEIYETWFPGKTDIQALVTARLDAFERDMDYRFINGVLPFIQELRAANIKTAVVTSSNKPKMASVLAARPEITTLFDRILSAEDYAASKPAPDGYLKGAEVFGADPARCAVFEDSINGLRAGRAAGSILVGLTTTNPYEAVAKYADIIIPDFANFTLADLEAFC
jgi:HAD superfamily hydrolase (TIGR01509 family)